MALKKVKKVKVEANDVKGLKSSRYEKLQVSYGVVEAADYAVGDTLVFWDVPARDIIKATVVAHAASPVTIDILPGTNVTSALPLAVGASPVKISYVIEYVRGTGKVANSTDQGDLLQITLGAS
jgi:hypothetical protein